MHALFDSVPIASGDGLLIIGLGIVFMVILEIEKAAARRFAWLSA